MRTLRIFVHDTVTVTEAPLGAVMVFVYAPRTRVVTLDAAFFDLADASWIALKVRAPASVSTWDFSRQLA